MTRKWIGVLLALSLAVFAGCSVEESDDDAASYRAAIPPASTVAAAQYQIPAGRTLAAVGDPADYPKLGVSVARDVNGVVTGLFDVMRLVVALPCSYFDAVGQVAGWGPFPSDDGIGEIVVIIGREPDYDPLAEGSVEFWYQFLRVPAGWDRDPATATAVISGASSPNAPQGPWGLFFIDFDADAAFTNYTVPYTLGGFAAAYNHLQVPPASGTDPGGVLTAVVAAFRDFVPEGDPSAPPANVDYLYGHFAMADTYFTTVDFLEFLAEADIHETPNLAETLDVRMAFLNGGRGRAEVEVWGGELGDTTYRATECWGDIFTRQYLFMADYDALGDPITATADLQEGFIENADPLFQNTLDALHIPSLAGLTAGDPTLMTTLDDLATCGAVGCQAPQ